MARLVRAHGVRGTRERPASPRSGAPTRRAARSCRHGRGWAPTARRETPPPRNLVRRYLAAFGPASRADVAQWTGFARSVVDRGLAQLELRRFRDEHGRELYDLPRAPLPGGDAPAPVRLLPRFDNLVLSHDDRRRVLADEHRTAVIQGGEVRATFLVDGFVAGLWSVEDDRVRIAPFAPLPRTARRDVEDEARRLEAFLRAAGKAP